MSNTGEIIALRLVMTAGDKPFIAYAAVVRDEQNVILIDTGIPGQRELIRQALAAHSIELEQLTKIIITHQDLDHIGSLPELVQGAPAAIEVLAHAYTKPYIEGTVPLRRGGPVTPVSVNVELHDGDLLPYAGGLRIIFTPGHSPDHMSLYHIPSRTLIAGDALTAENGVLNAFSAHFTSDKPTALASVAKLQELEIDAVIAFHGGLCTADIPERLRDIVANTSVD